MKNDLKEILGYISDINPQKIASHIDIADGTLNDWLQVWRSSFECYIRKLLKEDGWILVSEETPELKEIVLLAYIDRWLCDVNVVTGYKFKGIDVYYLSDNDTPINGKVVAWKPY